jgi:hypothetical protein
LDARTKEKLEESWYLTGVSSASKSEENENSAILNAKNSRNFLTKRLAFKK